MIRTTAGEMTRGVASSADLEATKPAVRKTVGQAQGTLVREVALAAVLSTVLPVTGPVVRSVAGRVVRRVQGQAVRGGTVQVADEAARQAIPAAAP